MDSAALRLESVVFICIYEQLQTLSLRKESTAFLSFLGDRQLGIPLQH